MIKEEDKKPLKNQKQIDEGKVVREKILLKMKTISKDFKDGWISTQQLANIIYPNPHSYIAPFGSEKQYAQNIYGNLLAGRLKKLEKEGFLESKKYFGYRAWKVIS